MIAQSPDTVRRRATTYCAVGVTLIVIGIAVHEWTLAYLLNPAQPFRLTARVHWWYVSLTLLAIGFWLILGRNSVQPIAVLAVAVVYGGLLLLLVAVDLGRAYISLVRPDSRRIEGEFQMLDPQLGWTARPGGKARVVREGVYDVTYQIDADGFRQTLPSAPADRHIYVLGDSFAFGWGVNDDETFASRLASLVAGRATVINMGVEGHGIPQIFVRFSQVRDRIRPGDIVIFTVIGDDIGRNWPDFIFASRMLFAKKALEHFPVFDTNAIRIVRVRPWADRAKALVVHAPWLGSLFVPLLLPQPENAWLDASRMVELTRHQVETRSAHFILVQLPTGGELRHGQRVHDLTPIGAVQLHARFPQRRELLNAYFLHDDDGHYSPAAHRFVADLLYEELLRRGWIQQ